MNQPQQSKIFCFDIETVPDVDLARSFLKLGDVSDETAIEELTRYHLQITDGKNTFPRQLFHKVVAISFLEARIDYTGKGEAYSVLNIKSGGDVESSEKDLIEKCFTYLNKERPRIVSFNGKTFDIPVLKYRSMANKIAAPWFYKTGDKWSNYYSKYSMDWHVDLLDAFSDFGLSARIKMSEVAGLLKVPCKLDVNGSEVSNLWHAGKIAEIRNYCEQDVMCTFVLYLHYALHSARITLESFELSMQSLKSFAETSGHEHLLDFINQMRI